MTDPRLTKAVARVRSIAYELDKQDLDYPRLGYAEDAVALRILLAALDAMTAERDGADYLLGEAAMGAQEMQTQHDLELATLRARLERAEADSARLDWMEAQGNGNKWVVRRSPDPRRGFRLHNTSHRPYSHATARAALDAARGAPQGGTT